MNSLKLTNSLTRKKEVFKPNNIKKISLYACGPTVYESPHVGNARTLVVFDVLFRVLKVLYNSNVTYVRNITDVDDKIIEASQNNKEDINKITKRLRNAIHVIKIPTDEIILNNFQHHKFHHLLKHIHCHVSQAYHRSKKYYFRNIHLKSLPFHLEIVLV